MMHCSHPEVHKDTMPILMKVGIEGVKVTWLAMVRYTQQAH
jgi:hypothetical protein